MTHPDNSPSCLRNFTALILFGLIVGITGFAGLTSRYGWKIYLEIFSHFQVQYLIVNLFLLFLLYLTRNRLFLLGGLLCCSILAAQILPWYLPPHRLLPKAASDLRIFIANVNTQNRNYEKVVAQVRQENPDLAIFMEVDNAWVAQLDSLGGQLPYSYGQANPYNLGLVIYSQSELINPQVNFFGTDRNPSILAQVTVNNQSFLLVATHPLPPVKPSFFHSRNRQLKLMGDYLQTLSQPMVLAGDLNITMWSPYYKNLIRRTNLKNARRGFGILPSWPTPGTYRQLPGPLSQFFAIPIDHCLHSREFRVNNIRTGKPTGSDHLPVIVDLSL
ncbi:MAG: endonuclease/exonuclease/phosphatase family protein [Microcoleaceae cyanobacterium]